MTLRFGFIGFRHAHITALYKHLKTSGEYPIAGVCEQETATRKGLSEQGIEVTHADPETFFSEVDFDVLACGAIYAHRGPLLIRALESGKHILSDKPICTRLEELDRIEALSREKGLCVGCQLDLRCNPAFLTLRRLIRAGTIGDVHVIRFAGQHPLLHGIRPAWYFEEGLQGGTLNDIAIHAVDLIPWLTGHEIVQVTAARAWNARFREASHFQDGAMLMLKLANGAGILGDVSYLTPDNFGYVMPCYWRFSISGDEGYAEASCRSDAVTLYLKSRNEPLEEPLDPGTPMGYLEDFFRNIRGEIVPDMLHTDRVLRATRVALIAQRAADTGLFPMEIPVPMVNLPQE